MIKVLNIVIGIATLAACSSGQDMYSKVQFGEAKTAPATADAESTEPGEQKKLTEEEAVTPPTQISGSALYCIRINNEGLPANEASAGCMVLKDGKKVTFAENERPVWGVASDLGMTYQFTDLPENSEYQVDVRVKADNSGELESQLPDVRVTALVDSQILETNIVIPAPPATNIVEAPAPLPLPPPAPTPAPAPEPYRPSGFFTLHAADDESLCLTKSDVLLSGIKAAMNPCAIGGTNVPGVVSTINLMSMDAADRLMTDGYCFSAPLSVQPVDCSSSSAGPWEFVGKQVRSKGTSQCLTRSAFLVLTSECADGNVAQEWVVKEQK